MVRARESVAYHRPMPTRPTHVPSPRRRARAAAPTVAVVVSRYNASVTDALLEGALAAYAARGGRRDDVRVVPAPGSYELPALALAAARTGRFAGVVALGCLIKGETSHDRHIAAAVASGLVQVTIATGVPATFGVLTVDTPAQAAARSGGSKGNKGADAMHALLDVIAEVEHLHERNARRSAPAKGAPGFAGRRLPDKAARTPASARRG